MLNVALSALVNLIVFVVIPFSIYYAYHRRRSGMSLAAVAQRAGLKIGTLRYVAYAAVAAALVVAFLLLWPPPLEPFVGEGSAQRPFLGLGLGPSSVLMALVYGVIQTGFSEEFLFRGLIAGSLSRRLSTLWANVVQALVFLLPHLALLIVMPAAWGVMPIILVGALFAGWLRIRSGSIVGPWILHASANVTMALSVAYRTAT